MSEEYKGLVVVIPTRNRAAMAMNAIRSVLSQPDCMASVLVADNSTDAHESASLAQFCNALDDARLRYITPPEPLSMTRNYDWAIRQALQLHEVNHFALLTDRMVFKSGQLAEITHLARLYPQNIISYRHDKIVDYTTPIRIEQYPWTGKVFRLSAERLLLLSSQIVFHEALPRIMNCIVPRNVFEAINERYESLFDSIAPDFNFCYRCLELYESIVYYDKAPLMHYGLNRSNGESQARGIASKDHVDFIANLGAKPFNFAAPIPEILTVGNAIIHEYCYVKEETHSPKFPEVDKAKYLRQMAREVAELQNPQLKKEMQAVLAGHGWIEPAQLPQVSETHSTQLKALSLKRVREKIRWELSKLRHLSRSNKAKPVWIFLMKQFKISPPEGNKFIFGTITEAMEYVDKFPRRRCTTLEHLSFLQPVSLHSEDGI